MENAEIALNLGMSQRIVQSLRILEKHFDLDADQKVQYADLEARGADQEVRDADQEVQDASGLEVLLGNIEAYRDMIEIELI